MKQLQRMQADIVFHDPGDVSAATAALIELDFDVQILEDMIDDYSPAVFVRATVVTEIEERNFFDWLQAIIDPLGGEVLAVYL
jgi:hypothetical protein